MRSKSHYHKMHFTFNPLQLCVIAFAFSLLFIHARSQPGFLSIDCGLSLESTKYNDPESGIVYITDQNAYIDGGVNSTVDANYIDESVPRHLQTVRYFPREHGNRSCYNFASLQAANKRYLIRATFRYGNYDGRNQPPTFDLYLGVDFWGSVQLNNSIAVITKEIIHVPRSNYLYVCLADSGAGTPFISALELRLLNQDAYKTQNAGESLAFFRRWNFAPANPTGVTRYPDDKYDRLWQPYVSPEDWIPLNTTLSVGENSIYAPPETVMQTAVTPRTPNDSLRFSWDTPDPKSVFYVYFYFTEFAKLRSDEYRGMYINLNDVRWMNAAVRLAYLSANVVLSSKGRTRPGFNFSLVETENSTLPPIINAFEAYEVKQISNSQTDENDVVAMLLIKSTYGIKRGWQGDPCFPKVFIWDGLDCIIYGDTSIPPRIRFLNMSSNGLNGTVSSYFSNLTFLESLDLSNNSLRGSIPDFLAELPQLKVLNLSGNKFSGSISQKLLDKANSGVLQLRADGYECEGEKCKSSNKSNKLLVILIAVPLTASIIIILTALTLIWRFRRKNPKVARWEEWSLKMKKLEFTYADIEKMTQNFQRVIGEGGNAIVYHGLTADGKQVAVKLLSEGPDMEIQFQTEANLLTRAHHRKLTNLVGYCYEGSHMALVYEYMARGNLQERLLGEDPSVLSWLVRLQIARDIAEVLNYLHKDCKPPIIHRDVKPGNILLNGNDEAKLADFGLSREHKPEESSYVSTRVIGTPGYVDPEYQQTRLLHENCDIYSLGVVMLQLITGRPVITANQDIVQLVTNLLRTSGDLRSIADPKLQGMYDVHSLRNTLQVAMACASRTSSGRPKMDRVLADLAQCIVAESARVHGSGASEETVFHDVNSSGFELEMETD